MSTLFDINGIVVVTGAAGLLGKEHTRAILNHSGSVALIDTNIDELTKFKNILNNEGHNQVFIYSCDINKKENVEKVLKDLLQKQKPIVNKQHPCLVKSSRTICNS